MAATDDRDPNDAPDSAAGPVPYRRPRRGAATPPPTPTAIDDAGCPVKVLGRGGGVYHYISGSGEHREIRDRDHTERVLSALFDGAVDWLVKNFPVYDQAGAVKPGAWHERRARDWLFARCADAGMVDPGFAVRGPGVWAAGDDIVAHCGQSLALYFVDGGSDVIAAGARRPEAFYPAAPALVMPADAAAGCGHGRELEQALALWSWRDQIDRDLVLGWIGAALLGAAPSWRTHLCVTGERGCGKSWLATYIAAALGAQAQASFNNFTEAGLRQAFSGEARAIVLDESEHDAGGRVQAVIGLLRQMSSGLGARAVRGSAGGVSRTFSVNGCAYLSSILHAPLTPQDRSRITVIGLDRLVGDAGGADQALAATVRASDLSPALRARALEGWPRFQLGFAGFRAGLVAAGADARQADQLATLLAGRDLLLSDYPADSDSVAEAVAALAPRLAAITREDEEEGEGALCLQHLLSSPVDLWRSGARQTVGQIVATAFGFGGSIERQALGVIGLKVLGFEAGGTPVLLVANRHVGLERLFDGSRWAGGAWAQALRYVAGAGAWHRAERFAGAISRATAISGRHLPIGSDDHDDNVAETRL